MDRRTGTPLGSLLLLLFLAGFVFIGVNGVDPRGALGLVGVSDSDGQPGDGLVIPKDTPGELTQYVGRKVSAFAVRVTSVDADEGFWVDAGGKRVWVQLQTLGESSYTVQPGQVVSFTGRVLPHDANFPNTIDFCHDRHASAEELSRQGAHVAVPVDALTFGVG
jgi:hypothetical protein